MRKGICSMERRNIVYSGENKHKPYTVLKPGHKCGKRKSLHAITDLFESERFGLTMEESTLYEIKFYQKEQKKKRGQYLSEKGLESKTF
jgi:hypothetical protein